MNMPKKYEDVVVLLNEALAREAELQRKIESYEKSASHQMRKALVEAVVAEGVRDTVDIIKKASRWSGPVWIIEAWEGKNMRKRVTSPFEWSTDNRDMYEWAEGLEVCQRKFEINAKDAENE